MAPMTAPLVSTLFIRAEYQDKGGNVASTHTHEVSTFDDLCSVLAAYANAHPFQAETIISAFSHLAYDRLQNAQWSSPLHIQTDEDEWLLIGMHTL